MRKNGVLMHITSLPSPYGIGTMGDAAYKFVDFLVASGQTYWQILPIGPTSYGDSPYQSFSTYAGNPYMIDLDFLMNDGYLDKNEYEEIFFGDNKTSIDFGTLYQNRYPILRKAVNRFCANGSNNMEAFCKEQSFWIEDYALFMALKNENNGESWQNWDDNIRFRTDSAIEDAQNRLQDEIQFWKGLQYLFFHQWNLLKTYANSKGVQIIGDVPIYVAFDSVDVWSNPQEFQLDRTTLLPIEIAGCPPDGFTEDGQLWGNPLFNWDYMIETGFSWWLQRIKIQCSMFDILRIDHFRGFDEYYSIPYGATNAKNGLWKKGPGVKLFDAVKTTLGDLNIIAEDLGFLTDSVKDLLNATGYPGMKVLLFGFDTRDSGSYLPHSYTQNSVAYIGTHDNETVMNWIKTAPQEDVQKAFSYLRLNEDEEYNWGFMRNLWMSVSNLTIVQMQDILGLYDRMNTPSTTGTNWKWRVTDNLLTDELSARLKEEMLMYERI